MFQQEVELLLRHYMPFQPLWEPLSTCLKRYWASHLPKVAPPSALRASLTVASPLLKPATACAGKWEFPGGKVQCFVCQSGCASTHQCCLAALLPR